jgi:hypothetical protein
LVTGPPLLYQEATTGSDVGGGKGRCLKGVDVLFSASVSVLILPNIFVRHHCVYPDEAAHAYRA